MKTSIELFSGTKSFSSIAKKYGFETFTIELNKEQESDLTIDILDLTIDMIPRKFHNPYFLWASPPCTSFSIASVSHHWTKDNKPKSESAIIGRKLVLKTLDLIKQLKPKYWFIENPVGKLRTMDFIMHLPRKKIHYCQYGDNRMKPTDIWTNAFKWMPRPVCRNGSPCHESAPRGSRTGTQGLKKIDRSIVPEELCEEIIKTLFVK